MKVLKYKVREHLHNRGNRSSVCYELLLIYPTKSFIFTGNLRWSSNIGDLLIPFSGVPFCINGIRLLECNYGPSRPANKSADEVG